HAKPCSASSAHTPKLKQQLSSQRRRERGEGKFFFQSKPSFHCCLRKSWIKSFSANSASPQQKMFEAVLCKGATEGPGLHKHRKYISGRDWPPPRVFLERPRP